MAKTTAPDTVVLVDDEMHNMLWLVDYLEDKGLKVRTALNANEAIEIIEKEIYRFVIIDLNIPVLSPLNEAAGAKGAEYKTFPGLFVADRARNRGYRDRQVVIYSVHRDKKVAEEVHKLGVTYIIKGRPKEIKAELIEVLSYDPTST